MNKIQAIGIFLILIGAITIIYTVEIPDIVVTGYQMATTGYPMSVTSPSDKISSTLSQQIASASSTEEIPVVIVLTAPTGRMAMAQQSDVLPSLQSAGFQLTMSTVWVANTMAGTVPAGNIQQIASNPYVDKVLYDVKTFSISGPINVKALKDTVPQIHADQVWAQGYTGQGVTVILIDSGIQNNHPWLMRDGQSLVLKEYTIVPGANDYTNMHGTHCAGIVASQDSTYKGVAPGIKGFIDIITFDQFGRAKLSWVLSALDKVYEEAKSIDGPVVSSN
jgi:subtilisin family serine protease